LAKLLFTGKRVRVALALLSRSVKISQATDIMSVRSYAFCERVNIVKYLEAKVIASAFRKELSFVSRAA